MRCIICTDKDMSRFIVGKYVPFKKGKQAWLQDALEEAQEDHFVDCPEAPYALRGAAFILDMIFMVLLVSSFNRIAMAIFVYFGGHSSPGQHYPVLFTSFMLATDVTVVYLYSLWTINRFGATPAKLLFNLQIVDFGSGRKLNFYQILMREIIGKALGILFLGAGFLMPLFRKDRRALHDLLSASGVKKVDEDSK